MHPNELILALQPFPCRIGCVHLSRLHHVGRVNHIPAAVGTIALPISHYSSSSAPSTALLKHHFFSECFCSIRQVVGCCCALAAPAPSASPPDQLISSRCPLYRSLVAWGGAIANYRSPDYSMGFVFRLILL